MDGTACISTICDGQRQQAWSGKQFAGGCSPQPDNSRSLALKRVNFQQEGTAGRRCLRALGRAPPARPATHLTGMGNTPPALAVIMMTGRSSLPAAAPSPPPRLSLRRPSGLPVSMVRAARRTPSITARRSTSSAFCQAVGLRHHSRSPLSPMPASAGRAHSLSHGWRRAVRGGTGGIRVVSCDVVMQHNCHPLPCPASAHRRRAFARTHPHLAGRSPVGPTRGHAGGRPLRAVPGQRHRRAQRWPARQGVGPLMPPSLRLHCQCRPLQKGLGWGGWGGGLGSTLMGCQVGRRCGTGVACWDCPRAMTDQVRRMYSIQRDAVSAAALPSTDDCSLGGPCRSAHGLALPPPLPAPEPGPSQCRWRRP